jgi:hypothetical protein
MSHESGDPSASARAHREPTVEQAAERAWIQSLTAQEIARCTDQPVELVMLTADQEGVREGRPVDDILRDRFRDLLD